jgi:metal regulatory transcription factor 2
MTNLGKFLMMTHTIFLSLNSPSRFHERCIESWKSGYCLMHGDTFFVFCCKICNEGDEYLRRLDFNFKTTLHLVLYDFAMTRAQKFYSVSKEIAPFLWENWNKLNIPFEKFISKEKLVKKIFLTVKKEDEFKIIGLNNKKKSDLVNLRRKCPPTSNIKLNLMNIEDISDKSMKKLNIRVFELKKDNEIADGKINNEIKVVKRREKGVRSFIMRSNSEGSYQGDYQNFDDSSDGSRSRLDWIIPSPSNFHGKNNPFHSKYELNVKINEKSIKKGQKMMFEKPEVRIVRTIKRRLSAKDIAAGLNQDSKRRKMSKRRKTDDIEIISEIIQPLTMPIPTYFPVRKDSNELPRNSFTNNMKLSSSTTTEAKVKNDNNLSLTEKVMNSTPVNSPNKTININKFFNLKSGIIKGQKISILAKRITLDGDKHYLLEWNNETNDKVENSE